MKTFPIPSAPAGPGGDKPKNRDDDNDNSSYAEGGPVGKEPAKPTRLNFVSAGATRIRKPEVETPVRKPPLDPMDIPGSQYARGGFVKGEGARAASYAVGGPVYGRTRDFLKEPVEFRDRDEGKRQSQDVVGDTADADQKYGKSGAGAGKGMHAPPSEKSKSSVKTPMPRK